MELRSQSHRWTFRSPDWAAAAVAGLGAGAVLMVLELMWASIVGDAWIVSRHVAALLMGPQLLQTSGFAVGVVAVALLVHYVIGILFGVGLAIVVAGFAFERRAGVMETIGALFGAVVYAVNFYVLTMVFPWFVDLRGLAAFAGHIIFGIIAALLYWNLSRR